MKTLKFRVSPEAIRRANNSLRVKGINVITKDSYNGIITAKTVLNGVRNVREISGERIKEAYGKSLREYAEKL